MKASVKLVDLVLECVFAVDFEPHDRQRRSGNRLLVREQQVVHTTRLAAVHIVEADWIPAVGLLRLTARQIGKQRHCEDLDADFVRT